MCVCHEARIWHELIRAWQCQVGMHTATFQDISEEKYGNTHWMKTKVIASRKREKKTHTHTHTRNVYNHIKLLSSCNTYGESDILPHITIMHIL